MDLILFCIFLAISFILIAMGLYKPEHTELSLIGFVFLFLLAFVVLNQDITFIVGTNTTSSFNYTENLTSQNLTLLTSSYESVIDVYAPITLGGALSHTIGYWLVIVSVIGFIGVILSLRKSEGFK
jgi:hypothetical protein